jgi:hypothetical protein
MTTIRDLGSLLNTKNKEVIAAILQSGLEKGCNRQADRGSQRVGSEGWPIRVRGAASGSFANRTELKASAQRGPGVFAAPTRDCAVWL